MDKFIPFEKLSKKKRQELCKSQRGSWGAVNPVTRKSKDAKAYDRKKARKWSEEPMTVPFDFFGPALICCLIAIRIML
ncbi:hypothetical protein SDC9_129336 [bioreactor metagenome]|uniref:Uncharacterized protein n=1 Tax=bioreactor metagenome TaxID=1076179 RepID=A0A645CZH6_9ZZZZ